MDLTPPTTPPSTPAGWAIRLDTAAIDHISSDNHRLVTINDMLVTPDHVISDAILQDFAKITPQYPGLRAPLAPAVCTCWLPQLAPLLDQWFGTSGTRWTMQAWFSIVTTPPAQLLPIQRLPHVDGTDPAQIAMMLYLHRSEPPSTHGGTAFFRHRSTGLSALTAENFPIYAKALQRDVARTGLPPAAYTTDGAPHFERIHAVSGAFNQAVFYRGNILHSGVIDNAAPLPADPLQGRLTINAFFSPVAEQAQQGMAHGRG